VPAFSEALTGPLFQSLFEEGGFASKALFNALLGQQFQGAGGLASSQARSLRPYFPQVFSDYLSSLVAASPDFALGNIGSPGATAAPTSFADFIQGLDFGALRQSLTPFQRGQRTTTFQPTVRRVR